MTKTWSTEYDIHAKTVIDSEMDIYSKASQIWSIKANSGVFLEHLKKRYTPHYD